MDIISFCGCVSFWCVPLKRNTNLNAMHKGGGVGRGGEGGGGRGGLVTRNFEFFQRNIHGEIVIEPLAFNNTQ